MPSCIATETAANIHIGQQKRLRHLKFTGEHSSGTAWSKQEQQCAGMMLFKYTKKQMENAERKKNFILLHKMCTYNWAVRF
jgi:hypothetical protein